jgi:hypothetical protein
MSNNNNNWKRIGGFSRTGTQNYVRTNDATMGGTIFGSTDVSNNTGNTTFRIGNNAGVVFVNGDIDMSGGPGIVAPINRIRNVRDPSDNQDVATKYYVEKRVSEIQQFDLSMGPTGPMGPPGIGDAGQNGPGGASGPTGCTGPRGPAGDVIGVAGLPGPTGAAGATGVMGPAGATGAIGPVGAKGDQGAQGIQGIQGSNGAILWLNPDGISMPDQLITDSYLLSSTPLNSVMRTVGPISVSATYGNVNRTIPGSRFYNTATQVSTLTVIPSGVWSLNLYANVPSNSDANQISLYAALFIVSGTTNQPSPDSLIIETKDGGDPGFYPPRAAYLPDHVKYISQSWSGTTNILDNSGGVIVNSTTRKLYKIDMPVEFTSIQDASGNRENVYVQLQIYVKNTRDRNQTASVSFYFQTDPNTNQTTYSYLQTTFGAVGIPGSQGPTGSLGPAGAPGETGPAGIKGTTGAAGPTGFAGPAGPIGPLGPTGPTGPAGQSTSFGEQYSVQYRSNPGSETDAVGAFGGTRNFRYEPSRYTKSVSDASQGSVILNDLACRSIHSPFYVEDPSSSITGTRPRTFIRGGEVSGITNDNYVIIASGRDSTNVSQNTPGTAADITHGVKLIHNYDDSTARINLHNGEKNSSKIGMKFDLVSGNIISSQDKFCIVYDSGAVGVGGMTSSQMTDLGLSGLKRKLHIRGNVMVGSQPGTTDPSDNAMIMLNRPTHLPATTEYPGIYHRDISSANAPSFNVGSTDVSGLSIFSPNFITFQTGRGATQNNSIVINTAGDVSVLGRTNLTGAVSVGKGFTEVTTHADLSPVIDISGTMSLSSAITNYIDQPRVKMISNTNMKNSDIPTFTQSANEIRGVVTNDDSGFLRLSAQTPSNSCIELIGANVSSNAAKFNNSVRISTGGQDAMIINGSRNVGIGTSEPGARLDVSGNARINSGAATSNALTTTGRVGINIASPTVPLDVVGAAKIAGTLDMSNNKIIKVATPSDATDAANKSYVDTTANALVVATSAGSATASAISLYPAAGNAATIVTNANTRMTVTTSGNVGIGTTSPSTTLDVAGAAKISGTLDMSNNKIIKVATPSDATDAANKSYVDSALTSGSIVNNPTVADAANGDTEYRVLFTTATSGRATLNQDPGLTYNASTNTLTAGFFSGTSINAQYIIAPTDASTFISTGGHQRMEVSKVGVITIGNNPFQSSTFLLNGGGTFTNYQDKVALVVKPLSNASQNRPYYRLTTAVFYATETGSAASSQWGGNSDTDPYTTTWPTLGGQFTAFFEGPIQCDFVVCGSDKRMKKNITEITDGTSSLQLLRKIKCSTFEYVDKIRHSPYRVHGFIAQDIKDIAPEAVSLVPDYLPNFYCICSIEKYSIQDNDKTETFRVYIPVNDVKRLIFTGNHDEKTGIEYKTASGAPASDASGNQNFKVKFKDASNNDVEVITTQIIDDFSFLIKVPLNDNGINDKIKEEMYFLYGQSVDDFHKIDNDHIHNIATAALQEVDRQQQADKARIAELEAKVSEQQSIINDILDRLKSNGM